MKSKRFLRRTAAAVLSLVMAFSPAGTLNNQAANTVCISNLAAFQLGPFERYDKYSENGGWYEMLYDMSAYSYGKWADDIHDMVEERSYKIEDAENKSFWEKLKEFSDTLDHNAAAEISRPIMWAGHVLTDTEFTTEAYVDYLSKILAMHEKGFLATAQTQAEYTARVNVGEELVGIFEESLDAAGDLGAFDKLKVKVGDLGDKKLKKRLENGLKNLGRAKEVKDLADAFSEEVKNVQEAWVLNNYMSLHEEQMEFLQCIVDNTDSKEHKELHEAAEIMMQTSETRLLSLIMLDPLERAENINQIMASGGLTMGLDDWIDEMVEYVSTSALVLADQMGGTLAPLLLKGLSKVAAGAGSVAAGFQIGSHIGTILMGNEYESYREILVMDEIAKVLRDCLSDYDTEYWKTSESSKDKRYEILHKVASVGEALAYVHLRGEHCAIEYICGKNGSPSDEVLDKKYQTITDLLNGRYEALGAVFPEPAGQVTVYVRKETGTTDFGTSKVEHSYAIPEIYIENLPYVSKKINESGRLEDILKEAKSITASMEKEAQEVQFSSGFGIPTGGNYMRLDNAYSTAQAVGLSFRMINFYTNAVHPVSWMMCANFDTKTGKTLRLDDVLDDTDKGASRKKLKQLMADALRNNKKNPSGTFSSLTEEEIISRNFIDTTNDSQREFHWYFSQDGFAIVFDTYQIAPYAAGIIEVAVPYYQLKGVIREEYLPRPASGVGVEGMPQILPCTQMKEEFGAGSYDLHLYGDINKSHFGAMTDDTAYEVKIMGEYDLIFYASEMRQEDVVFFQDINQENWNYKLSYVNIREDTGTKERIVKSYRSQ